MKMFIVTQGRILQCPNAIVLPEHFQPEYGQCPCYDATSTVMPRWGYAWDPALQLWSAGDHDDTCASQCTNFNCTDSTGPCEYGEHFCWCSDGSLTYAEYEAKHPENDEVQ